MPGSESSPKDQFAWYGRLGWLVSCQWRFQLAMLSTFYCVETAVGPSCFTGQG